MTILAKSAFGLAMAAGVCLLTASVFERRLRPRLASVILVVGLKSVGWLSALSAGFIILAALAG